MTGYRLLIVVLGSLATLLVGLLWFATQPFVRASPSQATEVDPSQLEADVRTLSQTFFPRSYDSSNLNAAADFIYGRLRSAGGKVSDQAYTVDGREYRNIIDRFGPDQGKLIVVGAHYDSYGEPTNGSHNNAGFDATTHTPGADDNASGVAGMLALARLLGKQPPKRPVELVAYTLEEPPNYETDNMGSTRHARALREAGQKVSLMIALEMIGYFSDAPNSQDYPVPGMQWLYPDRGNYIGIVGRFEDWSITRKVKALMRGATDLPVYSMNAPAFIPGVDYSDHASFWRAGYPALMITDLAFYRNRNYHRAGDTADTLDYGRMAKVVEDVYAVIRGFMI